MFFVPDLPISEARPKKARMVHAKKTKKVIESDSDSDEFKVIFPFTQSDDV